MTIFRRNPFLLPAAALVVAAGGAAAESPLHTVADGSSRVVKGAPYCAEAVHEQVQWLADPAGGAPNRVSQRQLTRLCRDGEGRTRQEVDRGGRQIVYLRDPVAGKAWSLDPERKTYRPIGLPGWADEIAAREHSERMREYAQRMREWAREVAQRVRSGQWATEPPSAGVTPSTPPTPPVPATPAVPPVPPAPPVPAVITFGPGGEREFDVRVMRLDSRAADWMPPALSGPLRGWAPRGPGVTTPLPAKEIDGLRVNGERTTWTIEAGKVGNDKPIQILREVWTSPELMLTVASRDFDPRNGEVLYRLQNVRRGEPDPALMRVPADYTTGRRAERRDDKGPDKSTDKPAERGERR